MTMEWNAFFSQFITLPSFILYFRLITNYYKMSLTFLVAFSSVLGRSPPKPGYVSVFRLCLTSLQACFCRILMNSQLPLSDDNTRTWTGIILGENSSNKPLSWQSHAVHIRYIGGVPHAAKTERQRETTERDWHELEMQSVDWRQSGGVLDCWIL